MTPTEVQKSDLPFAVIAILSTADFNRVYDWLHRLGLDSQAEAIRQVDKGQMIAKLATTGMDSRFDGNELKTLLVTYMIMVKRHGGSIEDALEMLCRLMGERDAKEVIDRICKGAKDATP